MSLRSIKKDVSTYFQAFDAHVSKTNGPEDVSDEDNRRFDELFEEADALKARLAAIDSPTAKRQLAGFRFLIENVKSSGRSPREIRELCAAAA